MATTTTTKTPHLHFLPLHRRRRAYDSDRLQCCGAQIQPDGQIVVVGYGLYFHLGDLNFDFAVARLNSAGSLDRSFGVGGIVTTAIADTNPAIGVGNYFRANDLAYSVTIQPDGGNPGCGSNRRGGHHWRPFWFCAGALQFRWHPRHELNRDNNFLNDQPDGIVTTELNYILGGPP